MLPSPAESSQLLWLAEVEHILGAASLQLAFAAARNLSSPIPEPPNETSPMGAVRSMGATRAHRPWGYGSGPFADVSATGADIFEKEWGEGAGEKDDISSTAEIDERFIIEQLEVSYDVRAIRQTVAVVSRFGGSRFGVNWNAIMPFRHFQFSCV